MSFVAVEAAVLSACALLVPAAATRDRTPPLFAGLRSATTCIPGPAGEVRTGVYQLRWAAAHDNVTPQRRIVYDIYQATSPGGESFARPTYHTRPGATAFATPPISSALPVYFVVRARDTAGNRDHNRRERQGVNPCV